MTMMNGAQSIAAERERQISEEAWTPDHDDRYRSEELLLAAVSYIKEAKNPQRPPPIFWPWDASWWKPKGQRRDLVRAGALIAAEIDRIDRLSVISGGDE